MSWRCKWCDSYEEEEEELEDWDEDDYIDILKIMEVVKVREMELGKEYIQVCPICGGELHSIRVLQSGHLHVRCHGSCGYVSIG